MKALLKTLETLLIFKLFLNSKLFYYLAIYYNIESAKEITIFSKSL